MVDRPDVLGVRQLEHQPLTRKNFLFSTAALFLFGLSLILTLYIVLFFLLTLTVIFVFKLI